MSSMLDEAIRAYPTAEQPPGCWWLPQRYGGSAPTLEQAAELDAAEKRERAARRAAKTAGTDRHRPARIDRSISRFVDKATS